MKGNSQPSRRRCSRVVTSKGQRVIPAELRRRYSIKTGTPVQLEDVKRGILIRPVTNQAIERICGIAADLGLPIDVDREPDREIKRSSTFWTRTRSTGSLRKVRVLRSSSKSPSKPMKKAKTS